MTNNALKSGVLILAITLLAGCDLFDSDMDKLSDDTLRAKWKECQGIKDISRLKATACSNYEKQCKKRQKAGTLACY
ncbi:hypothetical protein MSP8887_00738 [Marinomonas spartinae]|uniref:Lipoprotein n=1 Tax=Marinomonas spartinae TaxID=1792290 RepID=A0A1A8T893_9GAMM|nr:hypothetical protein [Marinomonas spartinae]SBS27820.1 hypothetical protein MSP8887_00738 [Marinomonas spartinae]SBS28570.1 hypothetical protein MSP8886_01229 [Marinomonas spartinae]